MNTDFSISNQNLLTISMDMFRIYGRAIADILENKANDLTDEQKIFWTNELVEVVRILGNYVKLSETIIEAQELENMQKILPVKNSQWN
jgi:hypothetical protein